MGTHLREQRELSNKYQHDRVKMVFKKHCVLVLWATIASALEGLKAAWLREIRHNGLSEIVDLAMKTRKQTFFLIMTFGFD